MDAAPSPDDVESMTVSGQAEILVPDGTSSPVAPQALEFPGVGDERALPRNLDSVQPCNGHEEPKLLSGACLASPSGKRVENDGERESTSTGVQALPLSYGGVDATWQRDVCFGSWQW